MNITLRIVLLIGIIIYYICIFSLLKKKSLSLRYTLLWLLAGVVMLLSLAFPAALERLVHMLGIIELTNGLFALLLFLLIIILVSITSAVSKLNDQTRRLAQKCALYERRIRELEETKDRNCEFPCKDE